MLEDNTPGGKQSGKGKDRVTDDVAEALESAGVSGEVAQAVAETLKANGFGNGHGSGVPADEAVLSENARIILEKRYLIKDENGVPRETPEDLFRRVAYAIAEGEEEGERKVWEDRFYRLLSSLKFLPNSPTLVNAGTGRGCLSACFVVSPDDTMASIMDVARDAAMIEKWGGGIGFGFSKLRPRKDYISTTHGEACGPIAVMKLYSSVGATLTQGAFRLGAHMGQLRDSHPDIREFIHCKDNDDTLQNFNISLQLTDEFMRAVEAGAEWELVNPRNGEAMGSVPARELWDEIAESAWTTGDPGVVFIDRVWETAPNPQMGLIETSNPCGEEFLEDHGNCCLGSINLDRHIGDGDFDWDALEETVRTSVRFLDDVINVNSFPLKSLREVNLATRRIGLGVMGFADALVRLNVPYDSDEALELTDRLAGFIKDTAWDESRLLAEDRGPFPEYERSALKERGMAPVRNSSVITIAPTGTISRIAGCSSGVEPHFAAAWWSNVLWKDQEGSSSRLLDAPASVRETLVDRLGDAQAAEILELIADRPDEAATILAEHGVDDSVYRTSMAIGQEAHVRMQGAWQKHVTNSVSKTINLPNSASVSDVKDAFRLAWETGCKAVTVYRDGSKSMQVLETGTEEAADSAEHLLVPRQRPTMVKGVTERVRSGHGTMFVTINFDEGGHPFEMFSTSGKSGGCDSASIDAISRLISLALRSGVDPDQVVEQLKGITCDPVWDGGTLVRSPADAVSLALSRHLHEDQGTATELPAKGDSTAQLGLFPSTTERTGHASGNGNGNPIVTSGARCPECSGYLIHQEGCLHCLDCGYNKCE
jgi:ribonucleoside-diphosphate reductase alpha chain